MEFLAAQGLRALKGEMQAFVDDLTAAGVVWPARKGVVGTPRRSELGDQGVAQGHDAQRSEGALRGRAGQAQSGAHQPPQRLPEAALGDARWHGGPARAEAQEGQLLPGLRGTPQDGGEGVP